MSPGELAATVASVAAAILVIGVLFAVGSLIRTLATVRVAVDDIRRAAVPLLTDVHAAVRQTNGDLVRMESLLETAESVTGTVDSASRLAYAVVSNPLVKVLALEGAEHGISVSAICPAYVRTPIVESQLAGQAAATGVSVERVLEDVLLAPQAVKRLLEPEEVAEAAAFLLGPGGRAVTGAPLVMDLGWTSR